MTYNHIQKYFQGNTDFNYDESTHQLSVVSPLYPQWSYSQVPGPHPKLKRLGPWNGFAESVLDWIMAGLCGSMFAIFATLLGSLISDGFGDAVGLFCFVFGWTLFLPCMRMFAGRRKYKKELKKYNAKKFPLYEAYAARPHAQEKTPEYLTYMVLIDERAKCYQLLEVGFADNTLSHRELITVSATDDVNETAEIGVEFAAAAKELEDQSREKYLQAKRIKDADEAIAAEKERVSTMIVDVMKSAAGYESTAQAKS